MLIHLLMDICSHHHPLLVVGDSCSSCCVSLPWLGVRQRESWWCANFLIVQHFHLYIVPLVGIVFEWEPSLLTNSASPFIEIGSNVTQIGERSTGTLYVAAFVMSRMKIKRTPTRTCADIAEEWIKIWSFIFK